MTKCAQRTGFLTLLTCGAPAVATCIRCGKNICASHEHNTPSGILCPDCAVAGLDANRASSLGLYSSYYWSTWNSDSSLTTYSPSDYRSFETVEGQGGEFGGGGASSGWEDAAGGADASGAAEHGAADFQDS